MHQSATIVCIRRRDRLASFERHLTPKVSSPGDGERILVRRLPKFRRSARHREIAMDVAHLVVLMLENRSFDCMLGRLYLGRPDFDGLTG